MKKLWGVSLFLFMLVFAVGCEKYNPVETLKVEEAKVRVYFTPELHSPIQYNQYQGRIPDRKKHRLGEYSIILRNTGKRNKSYIFAEAIVEPSLNKLIFNTGGRPGSPPCSSIPASIPPGEKVALDKFYFLAEGDPTEIERLAYQTKLRIFWQEGGKKWEKIVSVTPER